MNELQAKKLERIKHYATRYELVATNKVSGQKLLVGYCAKGRNGLFKMVAKNGEDAVKYFGNGVDNIHFAKKAADGATMGDWVIKFSGRTQREAILGGELEWFADALGKVVA